MSLSWISNTLISFLYWFVIAKNLLPQSYGIISTSINLMMMLASISMFGFDTVFIKLIPEYSKTNQEKKIISLIISSIKIIFISNLILVLIMFLFSSFFATILKISQDTVWIIGIGFTAFSYFYLTTSILSGYQNMRKLFKTRLIGDIIKFLLSSILILVGVYLLKSNFPFGYYGPLIGTILSFLIISLLRYDIFNFKKCNNCLNTKEIVFKYSLPAFVATLALLIFNNVPYVVLTILKTPEITGFFSTAMTVTSPILLVPTILNAALFPLISQLCVEKNAKKKQAHVINCLFRYCLFLLLPFAAFLILFSRELILLFAKSEYLLAVPLFSILGPALIIFGCGNIFLSGLYAIRKPNINRNIMVLTSILFLVSSIPLTYLFSSYGLSLAFLISVTILMLSSYYYSKKYLPLKMPIRNILKIFISSTIFFLICYITSSLAVHFIIKFVIVIFGSLFYLYLLLFLKFYNMDDVRILEFLSKKVPYFGHYILFIAKFLKNRI
jgi:O-antigen/teichoic acid export membrane protein